MDYGAWRASIDVRHVNYSDQRGDGFPPIQCKPTQLNEVSTRR